MDLLLPTGNTHFGNRPSESLTKSARFVARPEAPRIYTLLRRNKYLIVTTLAVCLLASFAICRLETPLYRAQALIEVQGVNREFLKISEYEPTAEDGSSSAAFLATQIRLLKSPALAKRVVDSTHLNETPAFFEENKILQYLTHLTSSPAGQKYTTEETARRLLGVVQAKIEGDSDLISVAVDTPDASLAAHLSNEIATEFINGEQQERWNTSLNTSNWMTGQLEEFRVRLQQSEQDLQRYADKAGLVFTSDNSTAPDEKLRQVQQDLDQAQANRAEKEAELNLLGSAAADTIPKVLDDQAMRDYNVRLTDLRQQLAQLSTTLTPEHYKVERVKAEIAVLQSALNRERSNDLKRIQNEYATSLKREDLLRKSYSEQTKIVSSDAAKAVRYNVLKREVDTNRELYGSMLQKVKEASMLSALRTSSMRLVEPAEIPLAPYRPSLMKNGGIGALCGIIFAMVLVLARERFDQTLKTKGEILDALDVPELGVIPSASSETTRSVFPISRHQLAGAARNGKFGLDLSGIAIELPRGSREQSLFKEAFHCAATSLLLPSTHQTCVVFLVTSPHPLAGKSTVVANLGAALARTGRRGLLIDADFRRPNLHSIFRANASPGLVDILRGIAPVSGADLIGATDLPIPNLQVLTAGDCEMEDWMLLESSRMAEVLNQARKQYEFILIDSPPMLQLTDARLLGRLSDKVILVFRAGRTRIDQALEATQLLSADGSRLAGAILNDWNVEAEDPRYSASYHAHYRFTK